MAVRLRAHEYRSWFDSRDGKRGEGPVTWTPGRMCRPVAQSVERPLRRETHAAMHARPPARPVRQSRPTRVERTGTIRPLLQRGSGGHRLPPLPETGPPESGPPFSRTPSESWRGPPRPPLRPRPPTGDGHPSRRAPSPRGKGDPLKHPHLARVRGAPQRGGACYDQSAADRIATAFAAGVRDYRYLTHRDREVEASKSASNSACNRQQRNELPDLRC